MNKPDYLTVHFMTQAVDAYFQQQQSDLASRVFLETETGNNHEIKYPGEDHGWFNSAKHHENLLNELREKYKKAKEFLKTLE